MPENRYRAKQGVDGYIIVQIKHWWLPFFWRHFKYVRTLAEAKKTADTAKLKPIEL
jgi:hypothetical protein